MRDSSNVVFPIDSPFFSPLYHLVNSLSDSKQSRFASLSSHLLSLVLGLEELVQLVGPAAGASDVESEKVLAEKNTSMTHAA